MDTLLDYSLRRDEEDRRRASPDNVENTTPLEKPRRGRWERFRGWERANRAAASEEEGEDPRRAEEFEGRAWRTPGEQIMAAREI